MFRTLHRHFVLTSMSLLTVVLIISFAAIYLSTAARLNFRPGPNMAPRVIIQSNHLTDSDFRNYIEEQRKADADRVLRELAIILILTGFATLTAGYFVSRYLADKAIKPVEEAYESQRQFIADASHELKTPLAVIDANIEAEIIGKKAPSQWLRNIQDETGRMNHLVASLLSLARLDETSTPVTKLEFDVSKVVTKVIAINKPLMTEKSLTLSKKIEKSIMATNNEECVRQIVAILLDNAIKYTDVKGTIEVVVAPIDQRATITIKNTHTPPIPGDKLARLFDRFYQADESHTGNGQGLGLAIAKRTAENIGAKLSVNQADGMVIFTLSL